MYCGVKLVSVLDEFVLGPSEEFLGRYTKDQLIQTAESYEVPVSTQARKLKETLLQSVVSGFVEKGVLSPSPVMSGPSEVSGVTAEVKMKERMLPEWQMQLEVAKL